MAGGVANGRSDRKVYPGKLTGKALVTCIVAAMGGLIFGYDIGISAPCNYRGALNIGFQMSITIGILAANMFNCLFSMIKGGWGRRLSLGGATVPALIFIIGSLTLSDTPNSLIERENLDQAKEQLKKIPGVNNVDEEFNDMVAASAVSRKVDNPWATLLQRKYRPHLTFAVLIPFFQQLTGINVIMFYAPVLFKTLGFGDDAALMSAAITSTVNFIATFISIATVDRLGRRFLFLVGGSQMFFCQVATTILIALKFGTSGNPVELPKWYAALVVFFICVYVVGFAWSWGPLGWLVPSEIFPLEIRSAAQSITVAFNMLFTFFIAQIFLVMLCSLKFGIFIFFSFWLVVMSIVVHFFLPETKGTPIDEMTRVWTTHWFWKRFVPKDNNTNIPNGGIQNYEGGMV